MLNSLSIKNYALIENLKVDFRNKLSIITGETGAGKSILLGGLSLVLGKRADSSLVNDKGKKCIIEAEFAIHKYNLESFFEKEDLDYESISTLRREILPNGKSRAFINDTPTNLNTLNSLSEQLIDIHSQHETLQLANPLFQFQMIDSLAGNNQLLVLYSSKLNHLKKMEKELNFTVVNQQKDHNELEFNKFLFSELESSQLKDNEQEDLEEKMDKLSHVEEIKRNLTESIHLVEEDQSGLRNSLYQVKSNLESIAEYSDKYKNLYERINSIYIELIDLVEEFERENESVHYNPLELERINERLELIYNLQKKHQVITNMELLEIQRSLEDKINQFDRGSEEIQLKEAAIQKTTLELDELSSVIHKNRALSIPVFIGKLEKVLTQLEMKNTRLKINLTLEKTFLSNGKDHLEFLISANKGHSFESVKKAASGGELSRIMLAIKSIMCNYTKLPAIIFDEIDTGVSGEISNKMAQLMQDMSEKMQVIAITHLPQIAAKGIQHYKVFKDEINGQIHSNIKLLDENERIVELAEMLGGKKLTESAIAHAKQLLN